MLRKDELLALDNLRFKSGCRAELRLSVSCCAEVLRGGLPVRRNGDEIRRLRCSGFRKHRRFARQWRWRIAQFSAFSAAVSGVASGLPAWCTTGRRSSAGEFAGIDAIGAKNDAYPRSKRSALSLKCR